MKKTLILTLCILIAYLVNAQVSKTVSVETAGTLNTLLNTVAKPTFTASDVTINTQYTFILVVNDGTINSTADQVVITVNRDLETGLFNGESYYKIYNEQDLSAFRDLVNSGNTSINAILMNNVNFNDGTFNRSGTFSGSSIPKQWIPIGTESNKFSGIFDGNDYTITGLYISSADNYQAFIAYASGSTVINMGLVGGYFKGSSYIASFIGKCDSTLVYNCYNTGTVVGSGNYSGGIVAYCAASSIVNCYNSGAMYPYAEFGGIAGYIDNKTKVINCYNKGHIYNDYASGGGIVGYNCGGVFNCYNSGTIDATLTMDCGGVVGYNHPNSSISYSYFLKQSPINTSLSYVGDLNWGTCTGCGSFNGSGIFASNISFFNKSYSYLREVLNAWVSKNNDSNLVYFSWDPNSAWPGFIYTESHRSEDVDNVEGVISSNNVVKTEFFNLAGIKQTSLSIGLNIVRETYDNGTTKIYKILINRE